MVGHLYWLGMLRTQFCSWSLYNDCSQYVIGHRFQKLISLVLFVLLLLRSKRSRIFCSNYEGFVGYHSNTYFTFKVEIQNVSSTSRHLTSILQNKLHIHISHLTFGATKSPKKVQFSLYAKYKLVCYPLDSQTSYDNVQKSQN